MSYQPLGKFRAVAILGLLTSVVALAAFLVTRGANEPSFVSAEDPTAERDAEDYTALLKEHSARVRYEQVIAGIRVGPDTARTKQICGPSAPATYTDAARSFDSPLDVRPAYLPPGGELAVSPGIEVVDCGGTIAGVVAWYNVPPDLDAGQRGGSIQIFRFRGGNAFALDAPSDLLVETIVAGKSAILSPPILADGFGPSALVVDEAFGLTVIRANGQTTVELIKIAESLGGTR